jgi:hypothetical protein
VSCCLVGSGKVGLTAPNSIELCCHNLKHYLINDIEEFVCVHDLK